MARSASSDSANTSHPNDFPTEPETQTLEPISEPTEEFEVPELAEGYEYVSHETLTSSMQMEDDETLSQQLFSHSVEIEKRTLSDRIYDHKEYQAQIKAEKQEREHQESAEKLASAIATYRANRFEGSSASASGRSVSTGEKKSPPRGPLLIGAVVLLSMVGLSSLFALDRGENNLQPQAASVVSSSPSASSSPLPSAPIPTWTAKAPEVTYQDITQTPVVPDSVDDSEQTPTSVDSLPQQVHATVQPTAIPLPVESTPARTAPKEIPEETATPQHTLEGTLAPTSSAPTQTPAPSADASTQVPTPSIAVASPTQDDNSAMTPPSNPHSDTP